MSSLHSPEELIRNVVVDVAPTFKAMGYTVESPRPDTAVLRRRYIPRPAYLVPLVVGTAIFALGVLNPNATVQTAGAAGSLMLICLLVAVVLAAFVRSEDRVTITAQRSGNFTRVLFSGRGSQRLQHYIRSIDRPPARERAAQLD